LIYDLLLVTPTNQSNECFVCAGHLPPYRPGSCTKHQILLLRKRERRSSKCHVKLFIYHLLRGRRCARLGSFAADTAVLVGLVEHHAGPEIGLFNVKIGC